MEILNQMGVSSTTLLLSQCSNISLNLISSHTLVPKDVNSREGPPKPHSFFRMGDLGFFDKFVISMMDGSSMGVSWGGGQGREMVKVLGDLGIWYHLIVIF